LMPKTCRGSRHNKVIVKVKVYYVGYVIVIHNETRSTKYQTYLRISYSRFIQKKNTFNHTYKPWITTGIRISCNKKKGFT
jgi:hypothetical protein